MSDWLAVLLEATQLFHVQTPAVRVLVVLDGVPGRFLPDHQRAVLLLHLPVNGVGVGHGGRGHGRRNAPLQGAALPLVGAVGGLAFETSIDVDVVHAGGLPVLLLDLPDGLVLTVVRFRVGLMVLALWRTVVRAGGCAQGV